jgi:hypothetical protein
MTEFVIKNIILVVTIYLIYGKSTKLIYLLSLYYASRHYQPIIRTVRPMQQ